MEVYVLNDALLRETVVDRFKSLIWTERFAAWGDFELDIYAGSTVRGALLEGKRIAMNESNRVMTVETLEDTISEEGEAILKVKGRSIEAILEDRAARDTNANTTTEPTWNLTGLPAALARQMFHDICVLGQLNAGDKIDYIFETSLYPPNTIAEPTDSITLNLPPQTLYKAIQDLCTTYDMGFRMYRDPLLSKLYFNVYMGDDRTTAQTTLPAVVFSPELDNLKNTSELSSIAGAKNVALVLSPVGSLYVYADGVDPGVKSFERRVLVVDASDITSTTGLTAALTQRGKEALAQNRQVRAFDGEITQTSQYKYERDYFLGDLVEVQNSDGATNKMQIVENIFVSDEQGERSYPTLQLNTFITEGSWLSWDYNQVWLDLDPSMETWADQP